MTAPTPELVNKLGRMLAGAAKQAAAHHQEIAGHPLLWEIASEASEVVSYTSDRCGPSVLINDSLARIDALLAELPALDGGLGSAVTP